MDISNGSNNIVGYCLVVAGVLSAAFYVVISSRLIKSFEPITLLSGRFDILPYTVIALYFYI